MAKATIQNKKRIMGILCIFALLIIYLVCNMFKWQILKGSELRESAYNQQTKNRTISPKRGVIYDRNGTVLAESVTVETISITPKNIDKKDKEKVAKGLSEILNIDYENVLAKTKKNTADETIAKKLDKDVTDKVRTWISENKIKGVNIFEDTKTSNENISCKDILDPEKGARYTVNITSLEAEFIMRADVVLKVNDTICTSIEKAEILSYNEGDGILTLNFGNKHPFEFNKVSELNSDANALTFTDYYVSFEIANNE